MARTGKLWEIVLGELSLQRLAEPADAVVRVGGGSAVWDAVEGVPHKRHATSVPPPYICCRARICQSPAYAARFFVGLGQVLWSHKTAMWKRLRIGEEVTGFFLRFTMFSSTSEFIGISFAVVFVNVFPYVV